MCGITGILHFGNIPDARDKVQGMTNALQHRGPDVEGLYNDDLISLGHRRLSIIDLSTSANQPFIDPSGRFVLVFNGEIYNYRSLKEELSNYNFTTTSDTEVLMAAFITWGIDCVHRLKGMFAFAMWDTRLEKLWLVRDRLGVKPLLFAKINGCVLFASERRALTSSQMFNRELDQQALFEFLSYQSTGYPGAILKHIRQLKAGSFLEITKNKTYEIQYWKPSSIVMQTGMNDADIRKTIFNKINEAVASRMVSDVPMGAFLSGGIDSSAVVALMSLNSSSKINTFNVAFTEADFDESVYAEQVSKRFGTHHEKVLLKPEDFLSNVEEALSVMDSPSMDGVNTYVISKAIRETGIKVAMSGIGGDELFAGYPTFLQYYKLKKVRSGYAALMPFRKLIAAMMKNSKTNRNQRLSSLLALDDMSIWNMYPIMRSVLTPSYINSFTHLDVHASNLPSILKHEMMDTTKLGLFSQYSIAEYLCYTQNTLLKDADQMSMAVGLEIREPFFDHELIEYVLSIPDHIKFPMYPKQLMVEALEPLLPKEIVHRPKQGFLLPWEKWMRSELSSFCEKQLLSISERSFINKKELMSYWQRFLKKDPAVRWSELWLFVVLGYWMDRNQVE